MKVFVRCLLAEMQKIRRTLALALTFLAPMVIVLLMFAMYTQHSSFYLETAGSSPWKQLGETMLVYWSLLVLPLFITLEAALLGQLEHAQKNWKLIYTMPVPRWAIYCSKLAVCTLLIALSTVILLGLMVILGNILQVLQPEFGFDSPIPWDILLRLALLSHLASWTLIAFHTWISVRSPSFVIAVGIGIAATIAGVFMFGEDVASFYPWTIPGMFALDVSQKDLTDWISLGIGWLGCIPLTVAAVVETGRRDVI